MKKTLTAAALLLALTLCLSAALADGGDAGDPLISQSYLEGTFSRSLDAAVSGRVEESQENLRAAIQQRVEAMKSSLLTPAGQGSSAAMKEGDALTGSTGLVVIPLAGELELTRGTAVDVTVGREAFAGQVLESSHRYIVAESSSAAFTAASPAVVASYEGGALTSSTGYPDYWAAARALRELELFRGTGSGIAEGLDLHLAPTRGEALVLFIRVLGEEADALACTDSHPFTDVPAWLDRYAAWAYRQGYANGVAPTLFGSSQAISSVEFEELMLRALGYSVAGVQNYATSLERGLECGALTNGEYELLKEEPFLRAHAAYLSYYALETPVSGTQQTLAQRLEAGGTFAASELAAARTA